LSLEQHNMSAESDTEDYLGQGSLNLFGDQGHFIEVDEVGYGPIRSRIVSPFSSSLSYTKPWEEKEGGRLILSVLRVRGELVAGSSGESFY
jgi:hypothetical protein